MVRDPGRMEGALFFLGCRCWFSDLLTSRVTYKRAVIIIIYLSNQEQALGLRKGYRWCWLAEAQLPFLVGGAETLPGVLGLGRPAGPEVETPEGMEAGGLQKVAAGAPQVDQELGLKQGWCRVNVSITRASFSMCGAAPER